MFKLVSTIKTSFHPNTFSNTCISACTELYCRLGMGGAPSTPRIRGGPLPQETSDYLIAAFVAEKSFPLASDYWQKLLQLPLDLHWPSDRVREACHLFAMNNCNTRHLAKILIHLAWCLQECVSATDVESPAFSRALNALFISSTFLKNLIESATSDNFEELYLFLDVTEPVPKNFSKGENVADLIIYSMLNFIAKVDVRPGTCLLHHELFNFFLIAMSTQLLSGPSPGPNDKHHFVDAAMAQESSLVDLFMNKLMLNYIIQPRVPIGSLLYSMFSEANQLGVLERVGAVAGMIVANLMLLPLHYLVSSKGEALRSPLADSSLNVLLILIHYRTCMPVPSSNDKLYKCKSESPCKEECLLEEETYISENPFCKAVENVRDIEFSSTDVGGNAHSGLIARLSFASLFDTLATCLADETSLLFLYSLIHGNSSFLEYVLVRTDLDTLLMPMLETLYNAPRRRPIHIYMVLIVLLVLSQDSSFNGSIHKLMHPIVPWYQEHRLHQTSLGSLMIVILVRTAKYNLSKLRDVYLHTNCLATLANMAPYAHHLSAYASQQLVSLFYMLSRKYNKLAELKNYKMNATNEVLSGDDFPVDQVLNFFNSHIDTQNMDNEWSVERVLEVIINNCRSWRGEGMKLFVQLRFSYEQESHPEEFFIPYVWQLILFHSGFTFEPSSINLFSVPLQEITDGVEAEKLQKSEMKEEGVEA